MFKRRSHQPQVSPLPHDSSASYPSQPQPPPQQHSQQQQQRYSSSPQSGRSPASTPSTQGFSTQNMNGTLAGPAYSDGRGMERVTSSGTTGSSSGDKGEKRKSGFFSLGRKGHKEKDKPEKESFDRPRPNSFSVERGPHPSSPLAQQSPQSGGQQQQQQQQNGQFQPYHMRQFPPPHNGHTPPPPDQHGMRNASNPLPLAPSSGEFGSGPIQGQPQGLPKSQSMGPQGFRVPDTHPYRGFLTAQQQQQQQQQQPGGLPRSASSPLAPPQAQSMSGHSGHSSATDVTDTPAAAPGPGPASSTTAGSVDQPRIVSRKEDIPQTPRERERVASATAAGAGGGPVGLNGSPGGPASTWMREFEDIVDLIGGQPGKTYVASPPELEMILARTSAGGQPKQGPPGSQKNDWDAVWLQLSGISLSMWSMKETRAAAARGEKVPPTYFNITDSSLELLAALPPPPHRPNSHPHPHVFSLNTAGSNRLLFSCPSERDLARWSTGLRLAAWERSKLEEIYTGHLIKSGGREPTSELQRGRMEGWVRVRVMGGTEWKRLWLVLSKPYVETAEEEKKNRRRSFFGLGDKAEKEVVQEPNTGEAMASFYPEPRTQKNRTASVAVLTITNVTQAYAVFPERLEVMSQSNLMKVVGRVHGEMVTIEGRLRDSGWALIMPELSPDGPAEPPVSSPLSHMMKWVTGVHDIFSLYGRPERYIWDRQNPDSLFFAYPQGEDRARLFLDIEEATQADFRLTNLAQIRKSFASLTVRKLQGTLNPYAPDEDDKPTPRPEGNYRLPPLPFTQQQQQQISPQLSQDNHTQPRSLTPITEQTDIASRQNSTKTQGTTRSQPLASSSDRRYSSEAPSKQGSGSSKFLSPGAGEERLAPIQDTAEFVNTEEPEPESATDAPNSASLTAESQSGPTIWSQDSAGPTPTNTFEGRLPAAPQPLSTMPEPNPATSSGGITEKPSIDSLRNHDLPELPPTSPLTMPDPRQSLGPILSNPPQVLSPTPRRVSSSGELNQGTGTNGLRDEPAAMYLMNMVEEPASSVSTDHARSGSESPKKPLSIVTNFDRSKSNEPLGRKPSGARALPPKKGGSGGSGGSVGPGRDLDVIQDAPSPSSPSRSPHPQSQPTNDGPVPAAVPGNAPGSAPAPQDATAHTLQATANERARKPSNDLDEDAAVFAAYADQPSPAKKAMPPVPPAQKANGVSTQPFSQTRSGPPADEVRSSFAPSKAAAERRAKAEQAAADQQRAMTMPGGGKRVGQTTGRPDANGEWSEDEDESDEDASPVAPMQSQLPHPSQPSYAPQAPSSYANQPEGGSIGRSTSKARALPPVPTPITASGGDFLHQPRSPVQSITTQVHALPPAPPQERPRSRSPQAPQQRQSSYYPQQQQHPLPQMPQSQPQSQPQPPATRQSVWNANFSQEHGHAQPSGKFVELEEPSVQLTKAFSPHGLLQAGMQDKEERSAKKQEELARETGSSLISVPSKPPPPSAGLLGAVAAHERDRKNAGGIGATLTDREREKRLNEERQREQMRMYGDGSPPPGMYPGMMGMGMGMPGMNMGMGMPSMPGYSMGFGYNPYAQQQAMMAAQMAYQQAMMQSYQQHQHPQSPPPGQPPSPAPPPPARPLSSQGGFAPGDGPDRPSSAGSFQAQAHPQQGQYFNPHMSMYGGWGGGMPGGMPGMSPMVTPWLMPGMNMSMPGMPGMGGSSPGMMQPNGYDWHIPNQGQQSQAGQEESRSRTQSFRGEERHEAN